MSLVPADVAFVSIAFIPLLSLITDADLTLHMVTTGETFTVSEGQEVIMECEIFATEFNLFDNPIVWRKRQLNEETLVNMIGNLIEPFASTNRLKVTFDQDPPSYVFGLYVSETRQEDTGNYSCEINGPQNSILASVTHQLVVRVPIDQIILTTSNGSRVFSHSSGTHLTLVERRPIPLRCTAKGGYPPPEIELYVSNRKVRDDFHVDRSVALSAARGLRRIYYETSKLNPYFMVEASDEGKTVKCVVTVPGMTPNTTTAAIEVHFAAIITCDNVTSSLGERNVVLRCEVVAKPPIKNLFWVIDDRGTTVREGDNNEHYSVLPMLRTDEIVDAQLILRQVKQNSFRKYTLVAENPVGMSTKDVTLQSKTDLTHRPATLDPRTNSFQSNPQNLRSSGFSFLQNDVGAVTLRHVTTFDVFRTLLTVAIIALSSFSR